jgi:AcrR family transcriptional regulator
MSIYSMSSYSINEKEKMNRNQAKLATKQKVLEAAESAFIKSDFKASTLQIAKQSRLAHGTIFFHFKNRDELVLSVIKRLTLRIIDSLYSAYKEADNLREFLSIHFKTVQSNWPLFKALFSGFSDFNNETRQEVITLFSVINYYFVEAFNRWADHGLVRTVLWQSAMFYLSFFGDYMFDKKNISEKFTQTLIGFMCDSLDKTKKGKRRLKGMIKEKKLCISCGMIFHSPDDFPMGDTTKKYCKYCAHEDGSIKSFDEVLDTVTDLIEKTQGIKSEAARAAAFAILSKNPVWKEYIKKYY